jgi:hypothetical protein
MPIAATTVTPGMVTSFSVVGPKSVGSAEFWYMSTSTA